MSLFSKSYRFRLDTVQIESIGAVSIDIAFRVHRSTKAEPNQAEIKIWNLKEDTRSALEKRFKDTKGGKRSPVTCELEAGYGNADDFGLIFKGDVKMLGSKRDGVDWITQVQATDGGHAYRSARASVSYGKGIKIENVVRDLVGALAVGKGNLDKVAGILRTRNGNTLPHGFTVHGSVQKALNEIVKSCGYEYSIQGGAILFQQRGKPIDVNAYLLSHATGLVGTPEPVINNLVLGKDGKPKPGKSGAVKVRTLLLHKLHPGARVQLDAQQLKGQYFAEEVNFVGDSAGNDWNAESVMRPVNG